MHWKKMLVGSPEEMDLNDQTVNARIAVCNNKATKAWAVFKKNFKKTDAVGMFRDTPAVTSGDEGKADGR